MTATLPAASTDAPSDQELGRRTTFEAAPGEFLLRSLVLR